MPALPDWQPLNGVAPPVSDVGGAGRIVALVASDRARSDGWAPAAALDLVRSWSRDGERVILVDGALQNPTLHEAAGITNHEGLSDATLHGASVGRVSQPVDDGAFFLIPAGTPVADTNTVVLSSRWNRLSTGMTEAGVTVALFLRDGEDGTAAFLGSAADIVVLADAGEPAPSSLKDLEGLVWAVTGPGAKSEHVPAEGAPIGPVAPVAEGAPNGDTVVEPGLASVIPAEGKGGMMTMVLFVILAVIVAGGLGYVLWSGIG